MVYTFQTIQTSEAEIAPFRPRFMQGDEPIQFEAADDYTVVAHLTSPNASFFTDISVPIVPKHVLEGQDLREGPFNRAPIGTGPFKVVEWNTAESIVLEANEDYFRGRPCIDRLIFRIIPDEQSQVAALQTGELDFLPNIPGASVPTFEGNPDFTISVAEQDSLFHMFLNLANPGSRMQGMPDDPRPGVLHTCARGTAWFTTRTSTTWLFYQQDSPAGTITIRTRGALLDEAGISDTDGDGSATERRAVTITITSFAGGFRDYADYAVSSRPSGRTSACRQSWNSATSRPWSSRFTRSAWSTSRKRTPPAGAYRPSRTATPTSTCGRTRWGQTFPTTATKK